MLQTKLQGLLKFPLFLLISFSCSRNKSRVPEVPKVGHQVFLVSASLYWFLGLVFHSLEMLEKKYFIAHCCVPNVTYISMDLCVRSVLSYYSTLLLTLPPFRLVCSMHYHPTFPRIPNKCNQLASEFDFYNIPYFILDPFMLLFGVLGQGLYLLHFLFHNMIQQQYVNSDPQYSNAGHWELLDI